jgi:hypothetical protein
MFVTQLKREHISQAASIALDDREERLEQVAESIEVDLQLIGASAIEDKLQNVSVLFLFSCTHGVGCTGNDRRLITRRHSYLDVDG